MLADHFARHRQMAFVSGPRQVGKTTLSPALGYFQQQLGAAHALQVVLDADYIDADSLQAAKPLVVPARTFLSQLV